MKEVSSFITRIKPLWQRDPRWRDVPMGSRSSMTIGNNGCLMTAITMITNAMGRTNSLRPDEALKDFHRRKAVDQFSGMMPLNGLGITRAYPDALAYNGFISTKDKIITYLNKRLSMGYPVLVRVDTSAPTDHWVVVVGRIDDDYLVADPLYGDVVSLSSRYQNRLLEALKINFIGYQNHPLAIDANQHEFWGDVYEGMEKRFSYAIFRATIGEIADRTYNRLVSTIKMPYSPYHELRSNSHTPIKDQLSAFRNMIANFPRTHISWVKFIGAAASDLERFIDEYEQAIGETIGVCSTAYLLSSLPEKLLKDRQIWQIDHDVQQPDPLPHRLTPSVWQFDNDGRIFGYDGAVNLNYVVAPLNQLLIKKSVIQQETPANKIDLLPYIRPIGNSNGKPYMIQMNDGRQERYQYQPDAVDPMAWYIVKNKQWEKWLVDADGIVRLCMDTSPDKADDGTARYYEVTANDGMEGGKMFPRFMAVGERYEEQPPHLVQFYGKATGWPHPQNSGHNHNVSKFVSISADGMEVIIGDPSGELHTYRKNVGRIAWSSSWGSAKISPDDAGGYNNEREKIARSYDHRGKCRAVSRTA